MLHDTDRVGAGLIIACPSLGVGGVGVSEEGVSESVRRFVDPLEIEFLADL